MLEKIYTFHDLREQLEADFSQKQSKEIERAKQNSRRELAKEIESLNTKYGVALRNLQKKQNADIASIECLKTENENTTAALEDLEQRYSTEVAESARNKEKMKGEIISLSEELTSARQSLSETKESYQKSTRFISKSTNNLTKLLEEMEDSRLAVQKLLTISESTKSSRWVKIGNVLGLGPKKAFGTMSGTQNEIKTQLDAFSVQLRNLTEDHIAQSEGNYSSQNRNMNEVNDVVDDQILIDFREMGDSAQALSRSRFFKIAKFLGLKSANQISTMLETYHASNDFQK